MMGERKKTIVGSVNASQKPTYYEAIRCSETGIKSEESSYLFRIDHGNLPNERADVYKEIVILDR